MEEFQETAERSEASSLQEERGGPGVSLSMFIASEHENNGREMGPLSVLLNE